MPVGRMGEASDIATAALFLATDISRYMLGAQAVIDGGILLLQCLGSGASHFYSATASRKRRPRRHISTLSCQQAVGRLAANVIYRLARYGFRRIPHQHDLGDRDIHDGVANTVAREGGQA
ncbi:hypothetical protein LMG27177_02212 [Paraburkholderia fynbosensis]|uniref:Uncharacterized protein n=2 Tax=Paraburkholderia fynbosensis TaxID=1200993 RepID=A0A6J5FU78_9BURK|nr:hypothetical protein LMG27177_02212 [Paraburkholderia fynbosensis]